MAAMTSERQVTCDYLVVGADPMSMAFVDALIYRDKAHCRDCSIIVVDPFPQPGGFWNEAHAFARLDSDSRYYGVPSVRLEDSVQSVRISEDLVENRATKDDLLVHYKQLMSKWVNDGRVTYFPMCTVTPDGKSIVWNMNPNKVWKVTVNKKVVSNLDRAPLTGVSARAFQVDSNVEIVTPNELSCASCWAVPHQKYVIMGSGRVGMDVVLWLLGSGVPPEQLHWIVSRDEWVVRREALMPETTKNNMYALARSVATSRTAEEVYERLEQKGVLARIDDTKLPEAYRGNCLSQAEIKELRKVENVVRAGHVLHVKTETVVLEQGTIQTGPGTLHIDCTRRRPRASKRAPIFSDKRIELQAVGEVHMVLPNPCFSAAIIGHLEGSAPDQDWRHNRLVTPVPPMDEPADLLRCLEVDLNNIPNWRDQGLACYLLISRPGNAPTFPKEVQKEMGRAYHLQIREQGRKNIGRLLGKTIKSQMFETEDEDEASAYYGAVPAANVPPGLPLGKALATPRCPSPPRTSSSDPVAPSLAKEQSAPPRVSFHEGCDGPLELTPASQPLVDSADSFASLKEKIPAGDSRTDVSTCAPGSPRSPWQRCTSQEEIGDLDDLNGIWG